MAANDVVHEPGEDPAWQESMALHVLDPETQAGAVVAFGTFPGWASGEGLTWAAAVVPDAGTFQRSTNAIPLQDGDRRGPRLGVGSVHWTQLAEGRGRLEVVDAPVVIDLEFTDLHPQVSWFPADAPSAALAALAHGHVEASCLVSGTITVEGASVMLDGVYGHRDQSWGPRRLELARNHRWLAGTCGPGLSFSLDNLVTADGRVSTFGYIVRDGLVERLVDAEIVVGLAPDCITPRSCAVEVATEAGTHLVIETTEALTSFLNQRRYLDRDGTFTATDTLFRVRCGELEGIADLNLTVNPLAGFAPPVAFMGGALTNS